MQNGHLKTVSPPEIETLVHKAKHWMVLNLLQNFVGSSASSCLHPAVIVRARPRHHTSASGDTLYNFHECRHVSDVLFGNIGKKIDWKAQFKIFAN